MAKKGVPKNTKNKEKHTKLMNQKANKKRQEKLLRVARLKEIMERAKEAKRLEK